MGHENLFIILDGHDQPIPDGVNGANILRLPHRSAPRAVGDRRRARIMSDFARGLLQVYDMAIATDIDEFLVVYPACGRNLYEHLSTLRRPVISALGLDVGQHLTRESPLDPTRPFLDQRGYAHVSARYTKPVIVTKPVTWGSGLHRVKGRNFHIDPQLYLFHFGMVDQALASATLTDTDRISDGWKGHLARREHLFEIITNAQPRDGDRYFSVARRLQSLFRPLYALNKPGTLPGKPVVSIPKRFRGIV